MKINRVCKSLFISLFADTVYNYNHEYFKRKDIHNFYKYPFMSSITLQR